MALPESLLADMADPDWWAGYLPDYREFDAGDHGSYPGWFEDRPPVDFPVAGGYGLRLGGRFGFWFHLLELTGPGWESGALGCDDGAHPCPHVFRWDEFDLVCRAMALNDPTLRYPGPAAALLCRFAFLSEQEDLDAVTPLLDASLHATRPRSLGLLGTWPGAGHWLGMRDLRGTGVTWHRDPAGNLAPEQDDQQRSDSQWPLHTFRRGAKPNAAPAPDDTHGSDEGRGSDGDVAFQWTGWRAMLAAAEQTLTGAADPAWRAEPRIGAHLGDLLAGELSSGLVLASLLAQAGCDHPTVLRALREPVHPLEAVWVAELLAGVPRRSLVARHCGPSPFHPRRAGCRPGHTPW